MCRLEKLAFKVDYKLKRLKELLVNKFLGVASDKLYRQHNLHNLKLNIHTCLREKKKKKAHSVSLPIHQSDSCKSEALQGRQELHQQNLQQTNLRKNSWIQQTSREKQKIEVSKQGSRQTFSENGFGMDSVHRNPLRLSKCINHLKADLI